MTQDYDIVIAGAGLSGRLTALSLAHYDFKVALVDKSPQGGGTKDHRTTAIAYACVRLLKRLGLWDELGAHASPIKDILVTNGTPQDRFRKGGLTGGALHFPSTLLGEDSNGSPQSALGYLLENQRMNEVFEKAVQTHAGITPLYGSSVETVEMTPGEVHLRLERIADKCERLSAKDARQNNNLETLSDSKRTQKALGDEGLITANLLIACDGKHSPLRQQFGFRPLAWGYHQKAIAFNLDHELPHEGVAQEIFYPAGPFAILPLKGNQSSIVWTEHKKSVDAYMTLDEASFLDAVQARVGEYLGQLRLATAPVSFPLSFQYVPTPVADRLVLVGDAAHTIHPIAGQGFNLGIKDIAALTHVLVESQRAGLDIGHGTVLAKYARWRRFDTTALALGTDALTRLFSNDLGPIRMARGLGLGLVQKFDPARKLFMRQAGADLGDLPALMAPL
ncbi:MAG: UbiH/UbiF/VisC/COQ6 family ubiquinone biosynthesis hydroxylase [Pseudomonadota bacterium]